MALRNLPLKNDAPENVLAWRRSIQEKLEKLGTKQAAIPDAATGTETATINAILAVLRANGLIST